MGGASSIVYAEAEKPLDASDITNAQDAIQEVQRLRNMLANVSSLPKPWIAYENEDGYVYYHNTETNDVQWNHPLIMDDQTQQVVEANPPPSPTKASVGKSLILFQSKLRTAAEHVVQRLLREEVEYEHRINLEMLEYITSLREELRELQGHKRTTGVEDATEISKEMEEQADYIAVQSAKEQKQVKKSKHAALMAKLEKKRRAKRAKVQKMKSQNARTIDGIEKNYEEKFQKQVEDSKHVMEHLDVTNNSEKEEGGGDKNAKDDENKWVELFDEETHRPYWWNKIKGSTWEKPAAISNNVFKSVHSPKCTANTNKKHLKTFMKKKSISEDTNTFTLQWIDEHAVRTERIKNQELWEKALKLEEELAHEREKLNGKDLQLAEHLEYHVTNNPNNINEENVETTITDVEEATTTSTTTAATATNENIYEMGDGENDNTNANETTSTVINETEGGFTNIMDENISDQVTNVDNNNNIQPEVVLEQQEQQKQQQPPSYQLSTINAVFQSGPLGLELVNRKYGGVIVKSVQPGYQAAKTRIIRRAMGIYMINEVDYSQSDLKAVLDALRTLPRPVTITFTMPGELNYITTTWQTDAEKY